MNRKRPERGPFANSQTVFFFFTLISEQNAEEADMWIQCNPNPVGRQADDCVVRAIAIATGQSWRETYRDLCRIGEREGDLPNSNMVWGLYLKDKGAEQFLLPESCPRCITVRAFADRYPWGTYVIGTGSHAVAVIDGDWYDAFDSGEYVPTYFWKIR